METAMPSLWSYIEPDGWPVRAHFRGYGGEEVIVDLSYWRDLFNPFLAVDMEVSILNKSINSEYLSADEIKKQFGIDAKYRDWFRDAPYVFGDLEDYLKYVVKRFARCVCADVYAEIKRRGLVVDDGFRWDFREAGAGGEGLPI